MKFLCVACDEPMKLDKAQPPDEKGSISALYECPECFTQIAMLTNPAETQLVTSLGIKIGPGAGAGAGAGAPAGAGAEAASEGGKCPFASLMQPKEEAAPVQVEAAPQAQEGVQWTADALARLENIPDFVRPMAKQGIEHYATSLGKAVVDIEVLDQAKGNFGM